MRQQATEMVSYQLVLADDWKQGLTMFPETPPQLVHPNLKIARQSDILPSSSLADNTLCLKKRAAADWR